MTIFQAFHNCPYSKFNWFALLLLGLTSIASGGDDRDIADAESQMLAFQSRSPSDLGSHYVRVRTKIGSTPECPSFFESEITFEELYWEEKGIEWYRVRRTFQKIDGESISDWEVFCEVERIRTKGVVSGYYGDKWVVLDKESWKSACIAPDPLEWSFATSMSLKGKIRGDFPFDERECVYAEQKEGKLHSVWRKPKGQGVSVTQIAFEEGLPIDFQIRVYPMKLGDRAPDPNQGALITRATTKWKNIEGKVVPMEVEGVLQESKFKVTFLAKMEWAFGQNIPKGILKYVESAP